MTINFRYKLRSIENDADAIKKRLFTSCFFIVVNHESKYNIRSKSIQLKYSIRNKRSH